MSLSIKEVGLAFFQIVPLITRTVSTDRGCGHLTYNSI